MNCLSFDFHSASVGMRKHFAFSSERRGRLLTDFCARTGGNAFLLCTCNRTELYFTCGEAEARSAWEALTSPEAAKFVFYGGEEAEKHLFRLACGLESMLIGEDEILGQVKDAFLFALERKTTDSELNLCARAAIACGKRTKAQTGISVIPRSVSTLAANAVAAFPKEEKRVLLIGSTGKMGRAILDNISAKKHVFVIATTRTHGGFSRVEEKENVFVADYAARYDYLNEADIAVCCTSSPHAVLTEEGVRGALKEKKKRLFLDISVPPDIEAGVAGIEDCTLVTLDDFEAQAQENNRAYEAEIRRVEKLLEEDWEDYRKEKHLRGKLREREYTPMQKKRAFAVRGGTTEEYCRAVDAALEGEE